MGAGGEIVLNLVIMCIFGAICAAVASSKGRNAVGWFFVGFLAPCIGLIIILAISNLKTEQARIQRMRREQRRLREQLKQERMKSQGFQQHVRKRLDRHDDELGIDTSQLGAGETDDQLQLENDFDEAPAQPTPDDNLPPADRDWFIKFGSRVSRALTFDRVRELYGLGNIDDDTLVRANEREEWRTLRDVPGLWEELNAG